MIDFQIVFLLETIGADKAKYLRGRAKIAHPFVELEYARERLGAGSSACHQIASGAPWKGAGLGLAHAAATKGDNVAYPAGSFFEFRLLAPVQLN